jgi:hypothetical protein
MPDISIISVPSYQPLQPYYYQVDNLPINALVQRDDIINSAVDTNTAILESAIGNTGTLAARLDQSLEQNGNLKSNKINEALHNIGAHEDGMYNGTDYVRMELSERQKLELISDEATNLTIQVDQISKTVFFNNGPIVFKNSTTISFNVTEPNIISAEVAVGLQNAHRHFYGVEPPSANLSPDYTNYITGLNVPFEVGSLRVYINGVRIYNDGSLIYVPTPLATNSYQLNGYIENDLRTGFTLDNAITSIDIIRIDFDLPLD